MTDVTIKPYTVVIFDLDKPNLNGRVYTKESMEKAISDRAGKPVLGRIGMAMDEESVFKYVSHQVTNLRIEGDKVIGTIEVLDTPYGRVLRDMLEQEVSVAYRSAGYGKIVPKEDGTSIVEDFVITSINAVNEETAA